MLHHRMRRAVAGAGGVGVFEDLGTYIEVDPASYITVAGAAYTLNAADSLQTILLYKDFGVANFGPTFQCDLKVNVSAAGANDCDINIIVSNSSGTSGLADYLAGNHNFGIRIYYSAGSLSIWLQEVDGNTSHNRSPIFTDTLSLNTDYWIDFSRASGVGNYKVYTDEAKTTKIYDRNLTLNNADNYRYFYPYQSYGGAISGTITGVVENFTLS